MKLCAKKGQENLRKNFGNLEKLFWKKFRILMEIKKKLTKFQDKLEKK